MGYIAALFIGISLGLIGGGGSILTVPVLVYLFGLSPIIATSYSLFIVGSTSLVGAYNNYRKGLVHLKTALLFGLSSITTVFITRRFILPAIPPSFGYLGQIEITKGLVTMILFAILMVAASIAMIRGKEPSQAATLIAPGEKFLGKLLIYGIGIGIITGLLGAGGGFLLIPTLVLIVKLPMKTAIGTSLLIIALNSLIGFTGDLGHIFIDWKFLLTMTAIAILGIIIGGMLNKRIAGSKLKKGFGWFVLVMGIYIIAKETILKAA